MTYTFLDFLKLIGSLGLFLYGMKIMSEGLQKIAGNRLRSILTAMTKNRVMGVFTGLLITALIQSSSATTVMVVSFVNAGLLSLVQSITVIMGANIGTTVTAWIISLLGFKVSIAAFSLPLMAIAIPFIFSSKSKRKSIGEFIMGFAFLFMGLELLKNSVPDLQANPGILEFLSRYTDLGFGSVLIFLGVGTLLTIVVQSSSATMAITLIMCAKGWISFELGAAMILGENIGTTVTANIAAIPANVSAKRAAFAHLTFNIFGVIWMLFVFFPFTHMVSNIVQNIGPGDPNLLTSFSQSIDPQTLSLISNPNATGLTAEQVALQGQLEKYQLATSYGLSLFHTMFNLINTFLMIWFVKTIAKIVSYIIPKKDTDEEFQLKYISTGMLSTSELSLLQARKEMYVYSERTERMYHLVRELQTQENENEFVKMFSRIQKYENISDRMEVEIAAYLTKVAEGRLSEDGKHQLQNMLRVVSEIESIGDSCYNLARVIMRKRDDKSVYTDEMNDNINLMMNLVEQALQQMKKILKQDQPVSDEDYNRSENLENEINNFRNQLKLQNVNDVKEQKYDYQASVTYMDMIVECEKMGDYIVNVVEALNELDYHY
ncbi:Na/Pi cotransporter family protein [Paludibacter sp. 221]|uniref:Na/Pi cotransporter family protein n=1 Tax=Paludibacter sp. 221 TaxID=2302939 RepID=UPI0013D86E74|nr:Na/Pi cotransporter family protein [Paludibacter sp. 221]NDV47315.1 Na/Pi cotransporter family protein [Paludibacter sp. 221]